MRKLNTTNFLTLVITALKRTGGFLTCTSISFVMQRDVLVFTSALFDISLTFLVLVADGRFGLVAVSFGFLAFAFRFVASSPSGLARCFVLVIFISISVIFILIGDTSLVFGILLHKCSLTDGKIVLI